MPETITVAAMDQHFDGRNETKKPVGNLDTLAHFSLESRYHDFAFDTIFFIVYILSLPP